jgi:hypothetical protein
MGDIISPTTTILYSAKLLNYDGGAPLTSRREILLMKCIYTPLNPLMGDHPNSRLDLSR